MRPHGKPQILETRRRRAIQLLKKGHTFRSVAKKVEASLSSVIRWHQVYRQKGIAGLKAKPHLGPTPLLSREQKKSLTKALVKGPLEAGFLTDLWTLKRIGQIVHKKFRVQLCIGSLWNLMDSLGWSCQKPQKKARERKEQAIRYWKNHVWPHIKKGQAAPRPHCILG